MSTFRYGCGEGLLGVRCDGCGLRLRTEKTGQEFPGHITETARSVGWEHIKLDKWIDYCPDCSAEYHRMLRTRHFSEGG